ncbi:MAG: hypothetical protein IJT00_07130 [Lachnospiraceae bacterium]|nr:hypothetical protein [Lachnospiraceae bacterium]
MRNLIRADLRRITGKPGLYLLPALALIATVASKTADSASNQMDMMRQMVGTVFLLGSLIPVFISVYGDELKSGVLINIIGRGMARRKIIFAKLLDSAILLLLLYSAAFLAVIVRNLFTDLAITPKQYLHLYIFCIYCVIRGVGYLALSSLAVFLAWNASGGMFILIVADLFSKMFLMVAQDKLKFPVYDMSFEGLLESSYAGIRAGETGWQLIPALLIFLAVVAVNVITFDRKEIDL